MKTIFNNLSFKSNGISFNGIALTRYIKSQFKTKEDGYAYTEKLIIDNPEEAREYLKKSLIEENHQFIHIYTSWAIVSTVIAFTLFVISIISFRYSNYSIIEMGLSVCAFVIRIILLFKAQNIFNWIPIGLYQMDMYVVMTLEQQNKKSQ